MKLSLLRQRAAALAVTLFMAIPAHASFVHMGDGTVLDTATNLVWLYDWNTNGENDWATQNSWAQSLSFAGASDWRLPAIEELMQVNQDAGGLAGISDNFLHGETGLYWSSFRIPAFFPAPFFQDICGIPPDPIYRRASYGVVVSMASASSTSCLRTSLTANAVAVRSAGPPPAEVPEPHTLALSLLALVAAASARRRHT